MYTRLPATAGVERTTTGAAPGKTGVFHTSAPLDVLKAYSRPSSHPTYTMVLEMVGLLRTIPPSVAVHFTAPVLASKAYSIPLSLPTKSTPSFSAAPFQISQM